MKQLLLSLILAIPLLSFSQKLTYFTVDKIRTYYWDKNNKPQLFSEEATDALFKIDTKTSIISFTTKEQTTNYYIKGMTYDEPNQLLQIKAVNETGFNWDISLDTTTIIFMGVRDNNKFGILYKVKKSWME